MQFFRGPMRWLCLPGLLLAFLFVLPGVVQAERLPLKTYTTADGLPRDQIRKIVRDSRGFLWFCTPEGLSRFDGYKFINYGSADGLTNPSINDFIETRDGKYWAATNNGLYLFNPRPPADSGSVSDRKTFTACLNTDESREPVLTVFEDHSGVVWCGSYQNLYRLVADGTQWIPSIVDLNQPPEIGARAVTSIVEDERGVLWITSSTGLYLLGPDGKRDRFDKQGLPDPYGGNPLFKDGHGRIWLASSVGLCLLVREPNTARSIVDRVYTVKDGLASNSVNCMFESSDGRLWIGTWTALNESMGVDESGAAKFRSYTSKNGIDDVTCLCEDQAGNIWVGTSTHGAIKIARNGLVTYGESDGFRGRRIGQISQQLDGQMYVFDGGGTGLVNRFDGNRFVSAEITLPKGVGWEWGWYQNAVQDHTGDWWLATNSGLLRFPRLTSVEQLARTRSKAFYTSRHGLGGHKIFRVFEDRHGDIWISTLDDPKRVLNRWERATRTFRCYSPDDGIPDQSPTAFCEDGSGNLWIGFGGGGLLRYSADRFTPFTRAEGVPPGQVRCLYLDHAGRLWVATMAGGVARIDNPGDTHPSLVTYSTAQGLSSNQATCITEDQWGMIYVGSGRGVDRLDPSTSRFKHYTMADGLANNFVNVCFRDRVGSLWFGTLDGLCRLQPEREQTSTPPEILISRLTAAGVSFPIAELGATDVLGPELKTSQNDIQVEFFGLVFAAGESLRYQYKLEGADKDWGPAGDQRTVNYPNLPPGAYRFQVRSISADGAISLSPAVVTFRILPPIWRRWWFVTLAALAAAGAVFSVHQYRVARLIELERVRTRIATDLHDDIGSSLSQIAIMSEVARRQADSGQAVTKPLSTIASTSRELVDSMSDIVWAINPNRDHLRDLTQRMRHFSSDILAGRNIGFRFEALDTGHDIRLGVDLRRQIFLIFKEAVNNIARHSGCSRAEIEFRTERDGLHLMLKDDGRGFDPAQNGNGHGLLSMRERARELGARLHIESANGRGTTVWLSVPLGRSRYLAVKRSPPE